MADIGPIAQMWRSSLYARAALFLALGAAAFVGAVVVLSQTMVSDSVDRLLAERLDLARMVGAFVENRLLSNLARLEKQVSGPLEQGGDAVSVQQALQREYPIGIYTDGAFFLSRDCTVVTAAPGELIDGLAQTPLTSLCHLADTRAGVAASGVLVVPPSQRPVLLLLRALRGRGLSAGYIGGVLPLRNNDALAPAMRAHATLDTVVDMVDRQGVVVASTDPRRLQVPGDHDDVLAKAVDQRRSLRGRCHGCHGGAHNPWTGRVETVLAFAALPAVQLGISVQQPERDALAPAFALQQRLVSIGAAFIGLFLLFAGLAVRSIVDPIKRLTREVHSVEASGGADRLAGFGPDELGELAATLERWRAGTRNSLAEAEEHRRALHAEIARTQRLLAALQEIAGLYMAGADAEGIVEHGLDAMLRLVGYVRGAVRVRFDEQELVVHRLLNPQQTERLLALHIAPVAGPAGPQTRARSEPDAAETVDPELGTVLVAHHAVPRGIAVAVVLTQRDPLSHGEPRWLGNLIHHTSVSVTTRLLHDRDLARQQQQAQYLHRVMRAQEEERRRVARELHDTVAQDLAALRLSIERQALRADSDALRSELSGLERRAAEVLDSVRRNLFDLRLAVLENLGCLPALQWHLERLEKDTGIRGILAVRGEEREPPYEVAVAIFRIFQESLQNIVSHARAEHITVTLVFGPTELSMVIEDDGIGFDVSEVRGPRADSGRGLGLLGMEERGRLVGGSVRLESVVGEGTCVTVWVPLPTREAA